MLYPNATMTNGMTTTKVMQPPITATLDLTTPPLGSMETTWAIYECLITSTKLDKLEQL